MSNERDIAGDPNAGEIAHLLGEAIRLHRSGRLTEAAQLCARIRQHAPNNLTALLLSGTIELTQSAVEYEAMAQNFAAAPVLLSKIREKLARNRKSCALFDTVRMTRNLEAAYAKMWQRHQRGESPASFGLP